MDWSRSHELFYLHKLDKYRIDFRRNIVFGRENFLSILVSVFASLCLVVSQGAGVPHYSVRFRSSRQSRLLELSFEVVSTSLVFTD